MSSISNSQPSQEPLLIPIEGPMPEVTGGEAATLPNVSNQAGEKVMSSPLSKEKGRVDLAKTDLKNPLNGKSAPSDTNAKQITTIEEFRSLRQTLREKREKRESTLPKHTQFGALRGDDKKEAGRKTDAAGKANAQRAGDLDPGLAAFLQSRQTAKKLREETAKPSLSNAPKAEVKSNLEEKKQTPQEPKGKEHAFNGAEKLNQIQQMEKTGKWAETVMSSKERTTEKAVPGGFRIGQKSELQQQVDMAAVAIKTTLTNSNPNASQSLLYGYKGVMDTQLLLKGLLQCLNGARSEGEKTSIKQFAQNWVNCGLYNQEIPKFEKELQALEVTLPKPSANQAPSTGRPAPNNAPKLNDFLNYARESTVRKADVEALADELSLCFAEQMVDLNVEEILANKPGKNDKPNQFVARFNQLSNFTASEIYKSPDLPSAQKTAQLFIQLAETLRTKGDYNSAFAILSGLGFAVCDRLTATLPASDQEKLANLQALFENKANFKLLRAQQHEQAKTNQPMLPFFGLFLKDKTGITENNPRLVDENTPQQQFNIDRVNLAGNLHTDFARQTAAWKAKLQSGNAAHTMDVSMLSQPTLSEDEMYANRDKLVPRKKPT